MSIYIELWIENVCVTEAVRISTAYGTTQRIRIGYSAAAKVSSLAVNPSFRSFIIIFDLLRGMDGY